MRRGAGLVLTQAAEAGRAPPGRRITMLNGRYRVVLLAGGSRDVAREIRAKLAKARGIYVKYHLETDKPAQWGRPLPRDIDFVIQLKDYQAHTPGDALIRACKADGVTYVRTQRKMSLLLGALHACGIHKAEGLPEDFRSVMVFDDDLKPIAAPAAVAAPAVEVEAAPPAAPALETKELAPFLRLVLDHPAAPLSTLIAGAAPDASRRGVASARLSTLAALLWQVCNEEGVSVICTPRSLELTSSP